LFKDSGVSLSCHPHGDRLRSEVTAHRGAWGWVEQPPNRKAGIGIGLGSHKVLSNTGPAGFVVFCIVLSGAATAAGDNLRCGRQALPLDDPRPPVATYDIKSKP
jgi:hypothetical protein